MARKKVSKEGGGHGDDIDMKPFINFLVVLIPVLILSSEFAKISIITLKLPEARGSTTEKQSLNPPLNANEDKLLLTMIVTDSVVTLGAKGGFLPSMFYKEYHKYVSSKDKTDELVFAYDPGNVTLKPISKKTGKEFKVSERQEILLYVADAARNVVNCMYTKKGEMLTDANYNPVASVSLGQQLYALSNPRRVVTVTDLADFESRPLSAYDEMKNRLMKVKERYKDASDGSDVIIAAEDQVAYDKIVQLMDVARAADFPNISIAKLRS